MIPAEMIQRARDAADEMGTLALIEGGNGHDARDAGTDAALRSLLTDLLGHLVVEPPSCGRPHVTGEFLDALLRALGEPSDA